MYITIFNIEKKSQVKLNAAKILMEKRRCREANELERQE
jgi:hypothetical protein